MVNATAALEEVKFGESWKRITGFKVFRVFGRSFRKMNSF